MYVAIWTLDERFGAFLKVALAVLLCHLTTAIQGAVYKLVFAVGSMLLQFTIQHGFLSIRTILTMAYNHSSLKYGPKLPTQLLKLHLRPTARTIIILRQPLSYTRCAKQLVACGTFLGFEE